MTSLVKVRVALKTADTANATLFTSLIDSGSLAPYSWKGKDAAKRKIGLDGPDDQWYPVLGRKQAPVSLPTTLTTKDVQEICLRDLPEAREYYGGRLSYFTPSDTAHDQNKTSEEDAGMQVINDLADANDAASGAVVSFPSEALEEMCSKGSILLENTLRATMTTCTVLPSDTLLALHHNNEGTTVTTLLCGSVAWIIWPPSDHNINTLQNAYEQYAKDFDEAKMDVAKDLEGGQIFVQTVGDGLRIPPFCLMMSLALQTSVLATNSHVTVKNFITMLSKLPLLKAWYQTEADGARRLTDFKASILRYLDLMLNGDDEHEDRNILKLSRTKDGLLDSLFSTWDDIKDDLAAMMGPADSVTMVKIWEMFLISILGRGCRMCNKGIRSKHKLMKKHFIDAHWVKLKKRRDWLWAVEGDEDAGESAQQAGSVIVDDDDEAMEVDE
jgi:hypothetical protein